MQTNLVLLTDLIDPGEAFLCQNWHFKVNVILIGVKTF